MIDLSKTATRVIIVAIAVVLVAVLLTFTSCRDARTAKGRETISTEQSNAATASGRDAVDTLGNRVEAEAKGDDITRENDAAIRNAEGASVVVAPGVSGAGLGSLCRRVSYQNDPRCARP